MIGLQVWEFLHPAVEPADFDLGYGCRCQSKVDPEVVMEHKAPLASHLPYLHGFPGSDKNPRSNAVPVASIPHQNQGDEISPVAASILQ